jgi:hypothetical protein
MDNDNRSTEVDDTASLKSDLVRARLGLVVHYVFLGFAPVLSVVALIVALVAFTGNQSNKVLLGEIAAQVKNMSANVSETKTDVDIFKVPLAHEKAMLGEERKKQAERETKIIKDVTQLQIKLKVSPTLEEQLRESAVVPVVAPPAPSVPVALPVSAPAVTSTVVPSTATAIVNTDKQPAPVSKPATSTSATQKPAPTPTAAEKATKAQALKETIEKFNKVSK